MKNEIIKAKDCYSYSVTKNAIDPGKKGFVSTLKITLKVVNLMCRNIYILIKKQSRDRRTKQKE
jgi:hypothetical protein